MHSKYVDANIQAYRMDVLLNIHRLVILNLVSIQQIICSIKRNRTL